MDKAPLVSGLLTGLFHFRTDRTDPSSLWWENKAHLVNLCCLSVQKNVFVFLILRKSLTVKKKNPLSVGYL